MFKWILFIFLAFLAIWFFDKTIIPASFRNSFYGKTANAVLMPAEVKVANLIGKSKPSVANLIEIDSGRLDSVIKSLGAVNKNAVIFFYDSNSLISRYVLDDINQLAKTYQPTQKVIFLVVAFEDDKERLAFLLRDVGKTYFRPIVTQSTNIKMANMTMSKMGISFDSVPVVAFKNLVTSNYENLPVDFGTKNILIKKIEGK